MGRQVHQCTICKREGAWTDAWQWYGSEALLEARPDAIIKTCSDKCRSEFEINKKRYRLPTVRLSGYRYVERTKKETPRFERQARQRKPAPAHERLWDMLTTGDVL